MCRNLSGCARIFETTRQKFSHRLIHWGTRYPRQAVGRWRSGRLGVFHSSPPAWAASLALAAIWAVSTPCGWAAEKAQGDQPQTVVDLFAGIQKGQIEAKLVAKDFTQCRLMVTNKTDAPISVRLPDVFAGVPVLAQLGMNAPGLNNNQPNSNNRNQKAPQSLGLTSPLGNMLNGINGDVVCKTIRENTSLSHIRILIISGVANPAEVEKLMAAGADGFIKKPFNIETVMKKIVELARR